MLEALFGLSRKLAENEPLKIFMALSDIDRGRAKPLEPATVDRLAREYRDMSAQYSLFAEAPALTDKTILAFLDTAHAVADRRSGPARRYGGNLSRAGRDCGRSSCAKAPSRRRIPTRRWPAPGAVRQDPERPRAVRRRHGRRPAAAESHPFSRQRSAAGPDDRSACRDGARRTSPPIRSSSMIQDMIRIFEAQRLVALNTLFDLADNLDSVSRGEKLNTALAGRLATRITEIQLPRGALTEQERNALAFGYWTHRHVERSARSTCAPPSKRPANDPQKLKDSSTAELISCVISFSRVVARAI